MPTIKIATVNCEWMNDWFGPDAEPVVWRDRFSRDGDAGDVAEVADRLVGMIRDIDADVVALEEGPSRQAELELFCADYLADQQGAPEYECLLSDHGGAQKLGLLWRANRVAVHLVPRDQIEDSLLGEWEADPDGDAVLDLYGFTRRPLVCDIDVNGHQIQVIVSHLKSNFVNQGEALWNDPVRQHEYVVAALKNRRRIATEAMRIRKHLEQTFDADATARVIVLGDLNDGPGQDYFETRYLAHNVTDILVGSAYVPERMLIHAQRDVAANLRYTAVFDDFVEGVANRELLLDHILLSPGFADMPLRKVAGSGTIEHAAWAGHVTGTGGARKDRPADHRPSSVLIEY